MKAPRADGRTKPAAAADLGVWIDHRQAVLVVARADDGGEDAAVRRITTNLDKQLRLSSGARAKTSYGPQIPPSDDRREAGSQGHFHAFLGEVVAAVRGARALYILGPGEAKDEFQKRLERDGLGRLIRGVEKAGRMSDRQLAAKVREHFLPASDETYGPAYRRARPNGTEDGGNMLRMEKSRAGMHRPEGRPSAERKALMKEKLETAAAPVEARPAVAFDFPARGERVASREYSLRMTAWEPGAVEVSIDDGAWRPCRQAVGYWWHDWSGYRAGPHSARARVGGHRAPASVSERREFVVEFDAE
jgi:hypothetical protein